MPSDSKNYLWVWVVIFSDMENTLIEFWAICCVSTMLNKHLVAKFKGIWYSPTFNWIFPDKTKFSLANCIKTFKTNPDNGRHPPLTASLSTRLLPFQHLSWFWNVTYNSQCKKTIRTEKTNVQFHLQPTRTCITKRKDELFRNLSTVVNNVHE